MKAAPTTATQLQYLEGLVYLEGFGGGKKGAEGTLGINGHAFPEGVGMRCRVQAGNLQCKTLHSGSIALSINIAPVSRSGRVCMTHILNGAVAQTGLCTATIEWDKDPVA